MISKKKYYETMASFSWKDGFGVNHKKWFECFEYSLRNLDKGFTKALAKTLFYRFEMSNAAMFHIENHPAYAPLKDQPKKLFEEFADDVHYCSDRMCFDRLFRLHWLFLQTYSKQMWDFELGGVRGSKG